MRYYIAPVGGLQTMSDFGEKIQPTHGVFHRRVLCELLHHFAGSCFWAGLNAFKLWRVQP